MSFAGVDGIDGAEALRGAASVRRPPGRSRRAVGPRADRLPGRGPAGRPLGTVEAVEANPASDLMVLDDGALIPLAFVVSAGRGQAITVDVPDGLVDLGLSGSRHVLPTIASRPAP